MKPTENRTAIILRFIHRHFIWMIVSSYIIAAVMPRFGLWIRNVNFGGAGILQSKLVFSLPLLMLATLLFNAGLGAKTEELTRLVQKPFVLLGGLFCNLTVPLAFIVGVSFLMHIWDNEEEVQQILVGLALVAAMPIAGASTAWSQNANGSLALSLGLVLGSTTLSPLLTPFVLHMAGFVTTGDYSEDLHELASGEAATFLGVWVILLFVSVRFHPATYWLDSLKPAIANSLIFGLGMNNNGTGLVLASVALADHPQVMLPIIFYNLAQHLVASIVALALFKSRAPKPPLPVSV
jgi:bile acid:Na+ symporter, BASS family